MKYIYLLLLMISTIGMAQIKQTDDLFVVLKKLDAELFEQGFNQCQLENTKNIVTDELEFYHDKGGFQDKVMFLKSMKDNICSTPKHKPLRKLINDSLEVFPMYKNGLLYAAIQKGIHEFYIKEPNKDIYPTGVARFTHLWVLDNKHWKLKRIFSYDHKPILALNEGKMMNELHKNNVGKIAFMSDWVAFDDFRQKDFVSELIIKNESDFGFRMFLGKTLTYYLHELEPELSTEELCNKGNFQLSFYVDDKQIYQYNLQTGAGSCDYKNSATVYGIPLVNKNNPDHWGRFMWMKFLKKGGGQQALDGSSRRLKIEVRPYIENQQFKVGDIIAQGEVNLMKVEKQLNETQVAIQTILNTEKWQLSTQTYDKTLIRKLNAKIAKNYFKNITSIVVIKQGELLLEEYFNGAKRNSLHDMRSVGKTMASTLMGIAIGDGYIKNEQQTLNNFYDLKKYQNYSPTKEKITLKSLLTMSSGFDGSDMNSDSPGNEENMYPTKDWVKFALDLPMDKNKVTGKNWDYFTAGAVVLGDILNKTVPEGLENYADNKLLQPLGITQYQWQYTPTGVPNTAGSFQMNTLDNARWGQLYLDNGNYRGLQILPQSWVDKSLSKQIALPNLENEYYGYLLWNKTYSVNDQPIESYYASGNGGNKIMIFKDIGVVIVITATAYNQAYAHFQSDEIIENYLLPSILTP